jgi:hypothetical protein
VAGLFELPVRLRDSVGSPPIELIFTKAGDPTKRRPLTEDGNLLVTAAPQFVRGDANGDKKRDLSDGVFQLDFLFRGGPRSPCADAADANDDGTLDISDAITILAFLFQGLPRLPDPFPLAGPDPTADALGCLTGA